MYNLVDAYFVGGLGESQMAAISVVYPLGQVVVGLGLLFGNGAASYISRLLGRNDKEKANQVVSTALYSSVFVGAVMIILYKNLQIRENKMHNMPLPHPFGALQNNSRSLPTGECWNFFLHTA